MDVDLLDGLDDTQSRPVVQTRLPIAKADRDEEAFRVAEIITNASVAQRGVAGHLGSIARHPNVLAADLCESRASAQPCVSQTASWRRLFHP